MKKPIFSWPAKSLKYPKAPIEPMHGRKSKPLCADHPKVHADCVLFTTLYKRQRSDRPVKAVASIQNQSWSDFSTEYQDLITSHHSPILWALGGQPPIDILSIFAEAFGINTTTINIELFYTIEYFDNCDRAAGKQEI